MTRDEPQSPTVHIELNHDEIKHICTLLGKTVQIELSNDEVERLCYLLRKTEYPVARADSDLRVRLLLARADAFTVYANAQRYFQWLLYGPSEPPGGAS